MTTEPKLFARKIGQEGLRSQAVGTLGVRHEARGERKKGEKKARGDLEILGARSRGGTANLFLGHPALRKREPAGVDEFFLYKSPKACGNDVIFGRE